MQDLDFDVYSLRALERVVDSDGGGVAFIEAWGRKTDRGDILAVFRTSFHRAADDIIERFFQLIQVV